MLNEMKTILGQAAHRVERSIAEFLPGLLALVAILLITAAVAWIARFAVRRSLQRIDFDHRMDHWGFSGLAEWSPSHNPSWLMASFTYWLIVLVGLAIGLSAVDASLTNTLVVRLLDFLPNLFAAAVTLVLGIIFARFAGRGVLISAVNLQIPWARLLSLGVKWLVMVLAAAMAMEHIGIGGEIVRLAFGILFGGIVLALALAVGLGSKDVVSRSLERQVDKSPIDNETASRPHHW